MANPGPLLPPRVVSWDAFLGLEPQEEPLEDLRSFVKARLAATVEDILLAVERTVTSYRHEFDRQRMQRAGVELKEVPPDAPGGAADQLSELEQLRIMEARGPVKEEQILVNISHTFAKEEPGTFPLSIHFPRSAIKEETQEVQEFSQRDHKPEEPEEKWPIQLPSKTQLDQNQDQGPYQGLNQDQDQGLNQDLEQDWEESVEWEFEGLFPGGRNPEQTDHSSKEEPSPDHWSVATVNLGPKVQLNDAALNQLTVSHETQNQENPVALDSGDEVTENSSDFSDSETKRSKSVTERSLEAGTQRRDVITNGEGGGAKAEKRKRLNRRMPEKGEKAATVKKGGTKASHTPSPCKRTFDALQKETPPCAICGKSFKCKSGLSRHMRVHRSHSRKEERREGEVTRGGTDKSGKAEEKKRKREKREREEGEKGRERMQESNKKRKRQKTREGVEEREMVEEIQIERGREERSRQRMESDNETDTDQTRDSSDEN